MSRVQDKHVAYYRKPARFLDSADLEHVTLYKSKVKNMPGDKHFETPRANFIKKFINYNDQSVLDIGCTTGFFIFDALDNGAKNIICYEGASDSYEVLVDFIQRSDENIEHHNIYFDFSSDKIPAADVVHLLNVVHHFGDDYGADVDVENAKVMMVKNIDAFAETSKYMVFQMGYNWKGNVNLPLFAKGEKDEVINFLRENLKSWNIEKIGIPALIDDYIEYVDVSPERMARNDQLGEFLNRPIFILKSKYFS